MICRGPWQAPVARVLCAATLLLHWPTSTASGQTRDNVLLVINDNSPASVEIGEYYARKRGLTDTHVVRIKTVSTDSVTRVEFAAHIQQPIGAWLSRHSLEDTILYLVLTKGVPLRVSGAEGRGGGIASVDSELTLLYRQLLGLPQPIASRAANPYFLGEKPLSSARPLSRATSDIYLVTRLDGFTVADTLELIDRGLTPSSTGRIVLDQKATLVDRGGDDWLRQAAERLRQAGAGDRVLLESTRALASTTEPVIGYFSWGSNDPANQRRRSGLRFSPGAIGGTFVSTDGRTFSEPPGDWVPSDPAGRGPVFGGSFQSLAGDLIRDGITGVAAHVAEPYLDATIRPQILFPAYLAGFNLAESFYLAMPYLGWQTVVVGDPLCAPFPRRPLAPDEMGKPVDPDTEMPGLFSERRLTILSRSGLNREALKLTMKADARLARGETSAVESLLIRATDIEPRLVAPNLFLARLYEDRREIPKAADRYRRVIAVDRQNVLALNNLAYALATTNRPQEGLPLAEQAYRLSKAPFVADTLGWIHHLLGDNTTAAPLLARAASASPGSVPILIHAAVVHATLNDIAKARAELAAALKLDPHVAEDPEVKALRTKLIAQ